MRIDVFVIDANFGRKPSGDGDCFGGKFPLILKNLCVYNLYAILYYSGT